MHSTDTFEVLKPSYQFFCSCFAYIQPIHLKYWNNSQPNLELMLRTIQPIHLKYWNSSLLFLVFCFSWFNRYIWSIETSIRLRSMLMCLNSTDTFEVLKPMFSASEVAEGMIQPIHLKYWNTKMLIILLCKSLIQPIHLKYWNSLK